MWPGEHPRGDRGTRRQGLSSSSARWDRGSGRGPRSPACLATDHPDGHPRDRYRDRAGEVGYGGARPRMMSSPKFHGSAEFDSGPRDLHPVPHHLYLVPSPRQHRTGGHGPSAPWWPAALLPLALTAAEEEGEAGTQCQPVSQPAAGEVEARRRHRSLRSGPSRSERPREPESWQEGAGPPGPSRVWS